MSEVAQLLVMTRFKVETMRRRVKAEEKVTGGVEVKEPGTQGTRRLIKWRGKLLQKKGRRCRRQQAGINSSNEEEWPVDWQSIYIRKGRD